VTLNGMLAPFHLPTVIARQRAAGRCAGSQPHRFPPGSARAKAPATRADYARIRQVRTGATVRTRRLLDTVAKTQLPVSLPVSTNGSVVGITVTRKTAISVSPWAASGSAPTPMRSPRESARSIPGTGLRTSQASSLRCRQVAGSRRQRGTGDWPDLNPGQPTMVFLAIGFVLPKSRDGLHQLSWLSYRL
jgi:hypothetical protein